MKKKTKRLEWEDKKKVFEAVTRHTILHMSGAISIQTLLSNVIYTLTKNNCLNGLFVKNIASLIDHLKITITREMLDIMANDAFRSGDTFREYILNSKVKLEEPSGLVILSLLDTDMKGSLTDWVKHNDRLINTKELCIDVDLVVGDRVQLLSPLLIPAMTSEKGVALSVNRNVDLSIFNNMIVAGGADSSEDGDRVIKVFIKKEGIALIKKKFITLKQ